MNWLLFYWLLQFFLIAVIVVIAKELKETKAENRQLKIELQREKVHCETKMAYADFRADAKIIDYKEEAKKQKMLNQNYKKELDRRDVCSGS